jgi:hypothetical protein
MVQDPASARGANAGQRGIVLEQIDEAVRLYEKGWSLARIGGRIGGRTNVDPTTMRNRLQKRG